MTSFGDGRTRVFGHGFGCGNGAGDFGDSDGWCGKGYGHGECYGSRLGNGCGAGGGGDAFGQGDGHCYGYGLFGGGCGTRLPMVAMADSVFYGSGDGDE